MLTQSIICSKSIKRHFTSGKVIEGFKRGKMSHLIYLKWKITFHVPWNASTDILISAFSIQQIQKRQILFSSKLYSLINVNLNYVYINFVMLENKLRRVSKYVFLFELAFYHEMMNDWVGTRISFLSTIYFCAFEKKASLN